jgi:hypothetical protein
MIISDLLDKSDAEVEAFIADATDEDLYDLLVETSATDLDDYSNSELYDALLEAYRSGVKGFSEYSREELVAEIKELVKEGKEA